MEIREYWQVVWKRRAIILPLAAVAFLASLLFNLVLPPSYKTETTIYVQANIPPPPPNGGAYYSEEYYRTVYSEYLADDLGVILRLKDFGEKVSAKIEERFGDEVSAKDINDSIVETRKTHRTLKVTIATGSEALTLKIGAALNDVLLSDGWRYFTRDERQPVFINVVDPPRDVTSPSAIRRFLDVLLHTAVALVVGVGIAFFLHYLDDRVQDDEDAARVAGWPVLGVLPTDTPGTAGGSRAWGVWADLVPRGWRRRPAAPAP
jgi:capsular polysaccharide biosynthesis protein